MSKYQAQFIKLQQRVLDATKRAIERSAPGLPLEMLVAYVKKVGGQVCAHRSSVCYGKGSNPFRIHVEVELEADIEKANNVWVVSKVRGWG